MRFPIATPATPDKMLADYGYTTMFWRDIFKEADEKRASDIHVGSLAEGLVIFLRLNGCLVQIRKAITDVSEAVMLVDRLKEICCLDTTTKKNLQDASFTLKETNSTYRISLSPGYQYGECAVLRIIRNSEIPKLDLLRLSAKAYKDIALALKHKRGLFLVTGPTGSGKSTTLQACIASMDAGKKKIISIENPPERLLPGVFYENITASYGWSEAIKGAMRQDPDVILVGEIRDQESAKLAVEASQTGHLVLSTLHANSVGATVKRLMTLGVDPHMVANELLFVAAQRLLEKLCKFYTQLAQSLHGETKKLVETGEVEAHLLHKPKAFRDFKVDAQP